MRIYLPALPSALDRDPLPGDAAFAVTAGLVGALPDEDAESLEYAALLAAADASLALLAGAEEPARRVVVAADVPDAQVSADADDDAHPAAVFLASPLAWEAVAAVHVDEAEAEADVAAALGGEADAAERVFERELLWYDASERAAAIRSLRA
ncbi:MAG: hypothetical protein LBT54_01070 [Bifidobacteriaceae bacterium]|jgi:hypothetical protein|nr:hypothetical protein [Bifidobacteriaceae bacterium]